MIQPSLLALIVDEDPFQASALATQLQNFGIKTELAKDTHEFVIQLKVSKPKICFLDINIDFAGAGFNIIESVRKTLGTELILIVVSSVSDPKAIAHAMEIGANDYILKPVDSDILATKLSRFIDTEKLKSARSSLLPIPQGGSPAKVQIDLSILEINEFGMTLVGKHLLTKESEIFLDGEFIQQITGSVQPQSVKVMSTWVSEDKQNNYASVEFDRKNDVLLNNLKNWLVKYLRDKKG